MFPFEEVGNVDVASVAEIIYAEQVVEGCMVTKESNVILVVARAEKVGLVCRQRRSDGDGSVVVGRRNRGVSYTRQNFIVERVGLVRVTIDISNRQLVFSCQLLIRETASQSVGIESIRRSEEIGGTYAVTIVRLSDRSERKNLRDRWILRKAGKVVLICGVGQINRSPAAINGINKCELTRLERSGWCHRAGSAGSAEALSFTVKEEERVILPGRPPDLDAPKSFLTYGSCGPFALCIEKVACA